MPTNDPYGLIASGIPPEIAAQLMGLQGRQAISQALLSQSQEPIQPQEAKGRFNVPISPFQGAAKVLQAYLGAKGLNAGKQDISDLSKKYQTGQADALTGYKKTYEGTPASGGTSVPQVGEMGESYPPQVQGGTPAVPANPRQAVTDALVNPYLKNSPIVTADMKQMEQEKEMRIQRQLSNEEAARARSENITARDAQARQAALDREALAKTVAGLKPDPMNLTEVVDPKDPSRMLRIDTRQYQGGTLGEKGVIGVSGKEPTAAKKAEQVDNGREAVSNQVTALRDYYNQLKEGGGITDPNAGTMSNIGAGIASSGVGQFAGRMVGTKNQSIRNSIAQQRPLLLQSIKQATGMSAKQMDSNVELKMYLSAATDPTLDIKANLAALDNLEKLYGLSGKKGGTSESVPSGVDPKIWSVMTPEEKKLWTK